MRKGSFNKTYEIFTSTATIAAHANAGLGKFRQKDVKFLIDLFLNWVGEEGFEVNNTQVLRFLGQLVDDGFARAFKDEKRPTYRLTRPGLIELVRRVVDSDTDFEPNHFFFLYYFIASYRPRIEELVAREGNSFPSSLRLELDVLLNEESLLKREIERVQLELRKEDAKISEVQKAATLARKLLRTNSNLLSVAQEINALYPYSLNSQKPLEELISEIPVDSGRWELEQGNIQRVNLIWSNTRAMLRAYLQQLQKLK